MNRLSKNFLQDQTSKESFKTLFHRIDQKKSQIDYYFRLLKSEYSEERDFGLDRIGYVIRSLIIDLEGVEIRIQSVEKSKYDLEPIRQDLDFYRSEYQKYQ